MQSSGVCVGRGGVFQRVVRGEIYTDLSWEVNGAIFSLGFQTNAALDVADI